MNRVAPIEEAMPVACTLSAGDLQQRLRRIGELAERALRSHVLDGRTLRLRYAPEAAEEVRALVAAERACCAFLDFDLELAADAVHLSVTAPAHAGEFAPALCAHFTRRAA